MCIQLIGTHHQGVNHARFTNKYVMHCRHVPFRSVFVRHDICQPYIYIYTSHSMLLESCTSGRVPINVLWRFGSAGKRREGARVNQLGEHRVQDVSVDDDARYRQHEGC